MAGQFEQLEDLIAADDPLSWAWDNLVHVNSGGTAAIFAHPSNDDLIVRVTDYPDGWFGYVDEFAGLGSPHAPRACAIAVKDGVYMAVAERLTEVPEEMADMVETARAVIAGGPVDADRLKELRVSQPRFESFAEEVRSFRDLSSDNWMMRGGDLVLNDPVRAMRAERACAIAQRYPADRIMVPRAAPGR